MKAIHSLFGIAEGNENKMVPCALYLVESEDRRHKEICLMIYKLFRSVGEPSDVERCDCYSYLGGTVSGHGGAFGFFYRPEGVPAEEWEPWQVPQWAIAYSMHIKAIINKAEKIGSEHGYNSGLNMGKSFVRRLASGEQTTVDFEKDDGRDSIRLHAKEW